MTKSKRGIKLPRRQRRGSAVGDRIISGLTELHEALREGHDLRDRFTVRTVEVPDPEPFDAKRVGALRRRLNVSQSVFARLIGVSTVLVQSWEQGLRQPSALACRLLAEVEQSPRRWRRMVIVTNTAVSSPKRKSA